ncbi:MAG: right-handed parallel beta-helix repeat-containing protein [Phycisphaerae bacterium]|jgi:pectin methylesterase-like acyl-CoA thioesterase
MFARAAFTAAVLAALMVSNASALTFYVNGACGNDEWSGLSPECVAPDGPKATIQAAIDDALNYDTIIVYPGTYVENISIPGLQIDLRSTSPEDPLVVAATIIDGGGNGTVVSFAGSEWASTVLRGFTITNGSEGGIHGNGNHATISHCVVCRNSDFRSSGGIYKCNGAISDCIIRENFTEGAGTHAGGGGLGLCDGTISHCLIASNRSDGSLGGGGLRLCNGTISHCRIIGNWANEDGGGLASCNGTIESCEISDNIGGSGGLAFCNGTVRNCVIARNTYIGVSYCSAAFVHCTIVRNWGSGVVHGSGTFTNCILACNYPYSVDADCDGPPIELIHCCVERGPDGTHNDVTWGPGNICDRVRFVFDDDFHLLPDSPGVDQGMAAGVDTDADGHPRPLGDAPDMGAYEFVPDGPTTALSPVAMTLRGTLGAATSDVAELKLANCGAGVLNWTLSADVDWLVFDPPAGSTTEETDEVTVWADLADLPLGIYEAMITIADPALPGFERQVPLQLAVGLHYTVATDGSGDYTVIQNAIDAAAPGTVIEILPGTYVENIEIGGKWIELRGSAPLDLAVVADTIIDGGANGIVVEFSGSEGPQTRLSGLTITNGSWVVNGNGAIDIGYMYSWEHPRATIEYCRLVANDCMAIAHVDGAIRYCTLIGNAGRNDYGVVERCHGSIRHCVFRENRAHRGAAITSSYCVVEDCLMLGNQVGGHGGAFYHCYGYVADCVFAGNVAVASGSSRAYGGAVYGGGGFLENCVFVGNTTDGTGGGVAGWCGVVRDCTICGNSAQRGGGLSGSTTEAVNCLITGNTAEVGGAGVYNCGTMTHCTIADNEPGGVLQEGAYSTTASGVMTNCIVWDNGPQALHVGSDATLAVDHCCVEGGQEAVEVAEGSELLWGDGNIDIDPEFYLPGAWQLSLGSVCVDLGTDARVTADLEAVPRPLADGYDLGAYEQDVTQPRAAIAPSGLSLRAAEGLARPRPQELRIANSSTGTLDWSVSTDATWLSLDPPAGQSTGETDTVTLTIDSSELPVGHYVARIDVATPGAACPLKQIPVALVVHPVLYVCPDGSGDYLTIQEAIDAAATGDMIVACPGLYRENIYFDAKDVVVRSIDPEDPAVVGATIIDGGGTAAAVTFYGTETDDAELSGFTITNGGGSYGAGIRGRNTTSDYYTEATISHCVIVRNATVSNGQGGGLYRCSGLIHDCLIQDNTALYGGGLCYCNGRIVDCTIRGNVTTGQGAGLFRCDALIERSHVVANRSSSQGGGLYYCTGQLTDCLIAGNVATSGAGLYNQGGSLINCDILGNRPNALRVYNSTLAMQGCIVRQNTSTQISVGSAGQLTVSYSNIEGGWIGEGNIDADPLFVRPGYWDDAGTPGDPADDVWVDGDDHLLEFSPCVNAGAPDYDPGAQATDLDGNPRVQYCRVDMGPYESAYFFDCNETGVSDACETTGPGDFTADGFLGFGDVAALLTTLGGPDVVPEPAMPPCLPLYLSTCDLDADGDLDLADVAAFQTLFGGNR